MGWAERIVCGELVWKECQQGKRCQQPVSGMKKERCVYAEGSRVGRASHDLRYHTRFCSSEHEGNQNCDVEQSGIGHFSTSLIFSQGVETP